MGLAPEFSRGGEAERVCLRQEMCMTQPVVVFSFRKARPPEQALFRWL